MKYLQCYKKGIQLVLLINPVFEILHPLSAYHDIEPWARLQFKFEPIIEIRMDLFHRINMQQDFTIDSKEVIRIQQLLKLL